MYDPIMRVLAVLEVLQARDHVTGAELAERLEVDLRTVQRYIVRLKDLSIPIDSSRGVGGAYRMRADYRLPPLLLTNERLSRFLSVCGRCGRSAYRRLHPPLKGLWRSLDASYPKPSARAF